MNEITLDDIIRVADDAYGNPGLVTIAHCGIDPGDTLAIFIASELSEAFHSGDAADNEYHLVADFILRGVEELTAVYDALRAKAREVADQEVDQ